MKVLFLFFVFIPAAFAGQVISTASNTITQPIKVIGHVAKGEFEEAAVTTLKMELERASEVLPVIQSMTSSSPAPEQNGPNIAEQKKSIEEKERENTERLAEQMQEDNQLDHDLNEQEIAIRIQERRAELLQMQADGQYTPGDATIEELLDVMYHCEGHVNQENWAIMVLIVDSSNVDAREFLMEVCEWTQEEVSGLTENL